MLAMSFSRHLWAAYTIDAGTRAGLQGSASYAGKPETDIVMNGTAVARVEKSAAPGVAEGQIVTCGAGWQDYSVHKAERVSAVDPIGALSWELGVLGGTGLTAYFGLLDVGRPAVGETVLVSAAAVALRGLLEYLQHHRDVGEAVDARVSAAVAEALAVFRRTQSAHSALRENAVESTIVLWQLGENEAFRSAVKSDPRCPALDRSGYLPRVTEPDEMAPAAA